MNSFPHKLASSRLTSTYALFFCACLFVLVPIHLYIACNVAFPLWAYCFCLAASRLLYGQAKSSWWASIRAKQGAKAEDEVGILLSKLPKRWKVERNIILHGMGDVDFVLFSPTGKVFIIDVKSHYGTVTIHNNQLYKRGRAANIPFEKDFIRSINRQVFAVREKLKCAFVTPIIVFTNAALAFNPGKVCNVYVTRADELLAFLINHVAVKSPSQN